MSVKAEAARPSWTQIEGMGQLKPWYKPGFCMVLLVTVVLQATGVAWLPTKATAQPGLPKLDATIIVIGAGMAGISAGKRLADMGEKNIIILEATHKIGGRMQTHSFANYTIEMGANWVEGVNGKELNPIWELAQDLQLRTQFSDLSNTSYNIYDASGFIPPQQTAVPYNLASADFSFAQGMGASLTAHGEEDISVLTAQRWFGSLPVTPVEMLLDYNNYDYEFAEPPRITSLKNTQPLPTFANFGQDTYFVCDKRGYKVIVEHLANQFLENHDGVITDPRLKLNKVVRQIKHSSKGVTVLTEDGSLYTAEYAIATVSIGVLQSKLIRFEPDLPFWKLKAIFQFDMAIYTKIFLKFPYKFWPTGPGTEFFYYADEQRGYYPVWQHLENEYPGSNIIFVTVTDDESRRIEQQPDNQTLAEIMVVLRKMFGEIPQAEDILVPRWWKNRFFGGTFSNWPIGVDHHQFQQLQAPVGKLYFSGEHTSEKYNGYVHGAYYSGIDAANAVLHCQAEGTCREGIGSSQNKGKNGQKSSQEHA